MRQVVVLLPLPSVVVTNHGSLPFCTQVLVARFEKMFTIYADPIEKGLIGYAGQLGKGVDDLTDEEIMHVVENVADIANKNGITYENNILAPFNAITFSPLYLFTCNRAEHGYGDGCRHVPGMELRQHPGTWPLQLD